MPKNDFLKLLFERNTTMVPGFPEKQAIGDFLDELFNILFSSYIHDCTTHNRLEERYYQLQNRFELLCNCVCKNAEQVSQMSNSFFDAMPSVYTALLADADAIYNFDPAANSIQEVLLSYPGFYATVVYRFSNVLYKQALPILPRMFSEYAHSITGIDIHPGAQIGANFVIDHGTGVVIGETTIIGDNVKIYQGVTLGALHVSKQNASKKRHPTIENNVIIYSGATILGGETVVGHETIIGGNVWLTTSVEPFSMVYHNNSVLIKARNPSPEPINFEI